MRYLGIIQGCRVLQLVLKVQFTFREVFLVYYNGFESLREREFLSLSGKMGTVERIKMVKVVFIVPRPISSFHKFNAPKIFRLFRVDHAPRRQLFESRLSYVFCLMYVLYLFSICYLIPHRKSPHTQLLKIAPFVYYCRICM